MKSPMKIRCNVKREQYIEPEKRFAPAKSLGAPESVVQAQDSALRAAGYYSLMTHSHNILLMNTFPQFPGYGVLAGLTQNGMIRFGVTMLADEMCREWIELSEDRDGDGREKKISDELERLNTREVFHEAMEMCGYYGGCLVFIDTGELDPEELMNPITLDSKYLGMGSVRALKVIEPHNITPGVYDTSRPWSPDYFVPKTWWIQGTQIHATRFLKFEINKVPTLLRPAYNFFGISTAQIVLDVVDHFTNCREALARLVEKFSLTVLKTDMSGILTGGGREELDRRIQFMVDNKDNDAIIAINNGSPDEGGEDIMHMETSLGGAVEVTRQAMDIVAAYFQEPAVKLWGISPAGLNATGESDLRNHYDHVMTLQNAVFRDNLETVIKLAQLNIFGDIDPAVTFKFKQLGGDDEGVKVAIQREKASIDSTLIGAGVITQQEARQRVANDIDSGYSGIDVEEVPDEFGADEI